MIIHLAEFGSRLQGKPAGRRDFATICGHLAEAESGSIVLLDFSGVESVNASWLNMAIAPLIRWCSESQNEFFPVLANYPTKDLDELELVAEKNQQCYAVTAGTAEPPTVIQLVGRLEPSLYTTIVKLAELGEATGAQLSREVPEEGVLPTAWNNRLRDLNEMRLLLRRKEGRQQVYRLLAKEVVFDG